MSKRHVKLTITPRAMAEGAGVTVHRTIGTSALRHLDPFLMLDHFGSDNPDEYIAGFPDHPHRGFNTLTYMLNGHMQHQDSMGNKGDLNAGDAQWMKAASGVIHSEMPQQNEGLVRGFQLWINLPAQEKMSAPAYQEYSSGVIPQYRDTGITVKILCGQYHDVRGPITDPNTDVHYFDVTLAPEHGFDWLLDQRMQCFIYVFDGEVALEDNTLAKHSFAVLTEGDSVQITASAQGGRFIIVAGLPIGEPIVQYGPFVMNTEAEIQQALEDYRAGRLVQRKAAFISG